VGEVEERRCAGVVALGLLLATLLACGAATTEELQSRAAFDLDCPPGSIKITDLGDGAMGVTGCGQRATYIESCDGPANNATRECQWVLNSTRTVERAPKKKKVTLDD
jgi:hypothetical protein